MGRHLQLETVTHPPSSVSIWSFSEAEKATVKSASWMTSSSLIRVSTRQIAIFLPVRSVLYSCQLKAIDQQTMFLLLRREALMVPAKGWQAQATAAAHGPLELALERQSDYHLRRVERIPSTIWCHIHRPEEGCRKADFQYTFHHPGRSPNEAVPHGKCHREHDVCLRRRRW